MNLKKYVKKKLYMLSKFTIKRSCIKWSQLEWKKNQGSFKGIKTRASYLFCGYKFIWFVID